MAPGTLAGGARLAGGRLAVLRTPPGAHVLTGSEIALMGPRGEGEQSVLRRVDGSRQDALDFDGRQVAAQVRGCRRVLYVREPVGGRPGRAPAGRHCRLRLAAPLALDGHGLRVRLACDTFGAFCGASGVSLRRGGRGGPVIARLRQGAVRFSPFTLRLPRRVRRRLAGTKVTLVARVVDGSSGVATTSRAVTARVVP
jgi:hypothetical protein